MKIVYLSKTFLRLLICVLIISGKASTATAQNNQPTQTASAQTGNAVRNYWSGGQFIGRGMSRTNNQFQTPGTNRYTPDSTETIYGLLSLVDPGVNTLVDGVMANYDMQFSNAVDSNDAEKMMNMSENIGLMRENTILVIERRHCVPPRDTLYLNMTGMRLHTYQWDLMFDNMDAAGRYAFLMDSYLNTSTQLSLNTVNSIQFAVQSNSASYAPNRFRIIFTQNPLTVLPVRMTNITGFRNHDKSVSVNWTSEVEITVNEYTIERSFDGVDFTAIGSKQAANNNGGSASYQFTDMHPGDGVNFYRVRSTTVDGRIDYTSIVKVKAAKDNAGFSIFPNPVESKMIQLHTVTAKGNYSYRVLNFAGNVITSGSMIIKAGEKNKTISLPAYTKADNYVLHITDTSGATSDLSFFVQ